MSEQRFNQIAARIFIICAIVSAMLIWLGLSMNSTNNANASTISEDIILAQGTHIDKISSEIPETIAEQQQEEFMNELSIKERAAEAENAAETAAKQAQEQIEAVIQQDKVKTLTTFDLAQQHYATVDDNSGHAEVFEQTVEPIPNEAPTQQAPDTINVLGDVIPFVYCYDATRAPEHGAGIWKGTEAIDDGKMCYFVGHNPGDFHNVMNLQEGNLVTVSDANGHTKTYVVHDTFIVPQKSTYGDIVSRVEGHGESIVMQTCCGDNVNVRIVIAW